MRNILYFTLLILQFTILNANEHSHMHHDHDSHTPINIMGGHTHQKGSWMTSYKYMSMKMDQNLHGSTEISNAEVRANGYMIAPQEMTMDMHMLGIMYAVSDESTVMVMLPYRNIEMSHIVLMTNPMMGLVMGEQFATKASGLGDINVSYVCELLKSPSSSLFLKAGLGIPTGSIDERGTTPMNADAKLPYAMQLGSGSYEFLPAITYLKKFNKMELGVQGLGTFRLNSNDTNYKLGDSYDLSTWFTNKWTRSFSTSYRLKWNKIDGMSGKDIELNSAMVQTADTNNQGGDRLDVGLSMNYFPKNSIMTGHQFGFEYLHSIHEDMNGIQLFADSITTIGWKFVW